MRKTADKRQKRIRKKHQKSIRTTSETHWKIIRKTIRNKKASDKHEKEHQQSIRGASETHQRGISNKTENHHKINRNALEKKNIQQQKIMRNTLETHETRVRQASENKKHQKLISNTAEQNIRKRIRTAS